MPRPQISLAALLVGVLVAGLELPLFLAVWREMDEPEPFPLPTAIWFKAAAFVTWAGTAWIMAMLVEKYVRAKARTAQPSQPLVMKLRTRVIGALRPGTIRIKVGIGHGMLDGGMENDVPADLIPPDLQAPNSEFFVAYGPDQEMIITRLDAVDGASAK
ncbi:MAG TPA: hypothetical protein VEK08_15075 [Planctomycetota bacterium]|nr:hypothetical protein [Planctomycetota bacterium]